MGRAPDQTLTIEEDGEVMEELTAEGTPASTTSVEVTSFSSTPASTPVGNASTANTWSVFDIIGLACAVMELSVHY